MQSCASRHSVLQTALCVAGAPPRAVGSCRCPRHTQPRDRWQLMATSPKGPGNHQLSCLFLKRLALLSRSSPNCPCPAFPVNTCHPGLEKQKSWISCVLVCPPGVHTPAGTRSLSSLPPAAAAPGPHHPSPASGCSHSGLQSCPRLGPHGSAPWWQCVSGRRSSQLQEFARSQRGQHPSAGP